MTVYEVHYPRLGATLETSVAWDRSSAEDVAVRGLRTHARALGSGFGGDESARLCVPHGLSSESPPLEDRRRIGNRSRACSDTVAEAVANLGLEAALVEMPPRRRACATLCFVIGLTPKRRRGGLGIAEGTVRKQLGLAKDDLRELIEGPQTPS